MSIPISPSVRKRNREVDEDQGGNAEKKGKAVAPQEPQDLEELAMPRLTKWQQHLGSTSHKLAEMAMLERMLKYTTQRQAPLQLERAKLAADLKKHDIGGPTPDSAKALKLKEHIAVKDLTARRQLAVIEQCQRSLKLLEEGPDDMGSPGHVVREACTRYLASYIRADKHKFMQGQIAWDVGEGQCLAFGLEYVQLRRAGVSPEKMFPHMRDISAKARISTVDEAGHVSFKKMIGVLESKRKSARDSLFTASLSHELTHRNDTWLSPPFTLAQHSLQTSIGYPSSIASKSLKRLHFVSIPDFSLESLALMWPSWKAMLPEVLPFSLAQGTASSTTSASSSSSSATALPPRSTLATKDMIVKDLAAYKANFAWLDHTRLGNPDDPYILLSMVVGGSGKRSKVSGHVIVVDLSPDSPGIFDPNLGFLAVHRGASGEEIRWLLSLVFLAYEVTSLDTWGVR